MGLKLKHIRHPFHTANVARDLVARQWAMWRFSARGKRHFARDPRFFLQSITDGFAPRSQDPSADGQLLERICDSYIKAVQHEKHAPAIYTASPWWEQQRKLRLRPVIEALATHDIAALGRMYCNFYRDPCSAGLIVSEASAREYFGRKTSVFQRRLYLIDTLYRLDFWKQATSRRFGIRDLEGPSIGNPFGVVVEGALVRAGAEYQHYCAHRIIDLLDSDTATVVEIGGGFGGMAYYLLRDAPGTTYINFDIPESIALASYYLLKAFPHLNFLLYGERPLTAEALAEADAVLMPAALLNTIPSRCADLTFSSHAMSDLSGDAIVGYLSDVARVTDKYFVCIGDGGAAKVMSDILERQFPSLRLSETPRSGWHDHRYRHIGAVECIYAASGVK